MPITRIPQDIDVDLVQPNISSVVHAKQNDVGIKTIVVHLQKDGAPYVMDSGVTWVGFCQGSTDVDQKTGKSYKFKYNITSSNISIINKTVTIPVQKGMVSVQGNTNAEVVLYDANAASETLCTFNFTIQVQSTGYSSGDEIQQDEYKAIQEILAEVKSLRTETQGYKDSALNSANNAKNDAQAANISYQNTKAIQDTNVAYTKEEIDLEYSHAPRKTIVSTNGEIDTIDSDKGKAYVELEGASEQYQAVANKNLIDLHFVTDDYYTGYHDGRLYSNTNYFTTNFIKVKPSTNYYLSGAATTQPVVEFDRNRVHITGVDVPPASKYGFTTGTTTEFVRINSEKWTKPTIQLEEGTTPTAYVPGSVETPSPEYPSEVKSVGEIPKDVNGVEIRNLLDEVALKQMQLPDAKYYWFETGFEPGKYIWKTELAGNIIASARMLFSRNKSIATEFSDYSYIIGVNGVINDSSFTILEGQKGYIGISLYEGKVKEVFDNYKIMFTTASEIDEYRPYIGANNGLVKLKTVGKNLIDPKDRVGWAIVENSFQVNEIVHEIKPGKNYVYFVKTTDGTYLDGTHIILVFGDNNNSTLTTFSPNVVQQISAELLKKATRAWIYFSPAGAGKVISEIQMEHGNERTPYQPYQSQTTWVTLKEPLRAIGDYKDTVDREGNVVQRIKMIQGKEMVGGWGADVAGPNASNAKFKFAYYTDIPALPNIDNGVITCDKLKTRDFTEGEGIMHSIVIVFMVSNVRTGLLDNEISIPIIVNAIKKWVVENNPIVYYFLAKANYITYQIPAIHLETYDPITHARCLNKIVPSKMSLDYKQSLQQLFQQINDAIGALGGVQ